MADGTKLAELLAKKKAARAERPSSAHPSRDTRVTTASAHSSLFEDDDESAGDRLSQLSMTATKTSSTFGNQEHTRKMAVVEVDIRDVEMDDTKVVAQGGLGILYKGEWRGCEVAIKKPVDPRAAMDASLKEDFEREVAILSELRHPNIVMLMGASLRAPNLCMLFEWCAGGSLYQVLRRSGSNLCKQHRYCIAACIASAVSFLHTGSPPIIHRDIKAQNVLLDDPMNPATAKLCDFGLAIKLSEASETNACQGTPPHMAPELFRGEACSLESDVYAFAITLWEIFSVDVPFGGCTQIAEIKDKVLRGERPSVPLTCPREAGQLIKECWSQNATSRPRIVQVLGQLRSLRDS